MSLLLKALENAAKNRESTGPGADPGQSAEDKESKSKLELSLEPVPAPAWAQENSREGTAREGSPRSQGQSRVGPTNAIDDEERGASPRHAQTVLSAGKKPVSRPGIVDWLARRPLVAFSTAAGLFAIGYGTYLYLQLTNPGIFVSRPPPAAGAPIAASPPPVQAPSAPPPAPTGLTAPSMSPPPVPGATPGLPGPGIAQAPGDTATPAAASASPPPATPAPPNSEAAPTKAPNAAKVAQASTKIAISTAQPEKPAAKPARKPRAVAGRATRTAPPEGVAPNAGTQVIAVSATLASAFQALEKGQLDDAERLYRQSLASDPRSIDAMLGLASTLTQQSKADAAAQYYLRVLEQDPRNALAQAGLLNLGGRADPVAAEARLKQLIAREPSAFLYFSLGNLYADQGRWASAQSAYFQAHNLAPDNPDYAFNLAVGLEHVSQPKIALDYYRRAVALAQSRGHAQFDAASVQSRIRSLETALAQQP